MSSKYTCVQVYLHAKGLAKAPQQRAARATTSTAALRSSAKRAADMGGNRPSDIRRASLAANRWIAGTTFSIADIPLAHLLELAEHMDTLSGFPGITEAASAPAQVEQAYHYVHMAPLL